LPSGLNVADLTMPSCRSGSYTRVPVAISQTRARLSSDAVTSHLPSGLKLTPLTQLPCASAPEKICFPVLTSQICAVPSSEPVARNLPSGLNAAETTAPLWRNGSVSGCEEITSQIRAERSFETVASNMPSGLKQ